MISYVKEPRELLHQFHCLRFYLPPRLLIERSDTKTYKLSPRSSKMDIRVLRPSDIPNVQTANITNLPENYFCKYYLYHAMSWPQLSYVAVDVRSNSVFRSHKCTGGGFLSISIHKLSGLGEFEPARLSSLQRSQDATAGVLTQFRFHAHRRHRMTRQRLSATSSRRWKRNPRTAYSTATSRA